MPGKSSHRDVASSTRSFLDSLAVVLVSEPGSGYVTACSLELQMDTPTSIDDTVGLLQLDTGLGAKRCLSPSHDIPVAKHQRAFDDTPPLLCVRTARNGIFNEEN